MARWSVFPDGDEPVQAVTALAEQVRQKQATYPGQSRASYLRRVVTMTAMKFVGLRPVFQWFVALCKWRGLDHDETLGTALRAFSGFLTFFFAAGACFGLFLKISMPFSPAVVSANPYPSRAPCPAHAAVPPHPTA